MAPSPDRTVVVGTSGAGKSTLARRIAAVRGIPHVELDALHWEPGWVEAPDAIMRARVTTAIAGDRWVVDGNYLQIADLTWARATRIVWLDPSFPRVLFRIVRRTLGRAVTRERLWHGETERLWTTFFTRDSVIWWAITTFRSRRQTYTRRMAEPGSPPFVHLRTPADVARFLAAEAA